MANRTEYDRIEITRDGIIMVRLRKIIVDAEGREHQYGGPNHFHRFSMQPGTNVDEDINLVNAHLSDLGVGPIPVADAVEIKKVVALIQTPERIQQWKDKIAADDAQLFRNTI